MFARVSKQFVTGVRRFSHESEIQLETWIKINDRMHLDAAAKAEMAVSGVKADVAALREEFKVDVATLRADFSALRTEVRTEVAVLKNDMNAIKSDVNDLRKGQIELHKQISNLHDQSVSQTRLLLAGGTAIAGTFFAANQYVEYTKEKNGKQLVLI